MVASAWTKHFRTHVTYYMKYLSSFDVLNHILEYGKVSIGVEQKCVFLI